MFRLPGDCHTYHCIPGKARCGLTRAIWELNPVEKNDGATLFISGSHKAAYTAPSSAYQLDSPLWEKIPEHKRNDLINQIPSKRIGQAEDLIPIFKCLIESSYINGAHLSLDGGL